MIFIFQDGPTVKEFGIIVLLGQVWVLREKKRVLREEEGRTKLGGRRSVETYHKCKN